MPAEVYVFTAGAAGLILKVHACFEPFALVHVQTPTPSKSMDSASYIACVVVGSARSNASLATSQRLSRMGPRLLGGSSTRPAALKVAVSRANL